jgi:large subunit ribosomal protein L2
MGKRIISQARGKGSLSYQAKKSAFKHTICYPRFDGEAQITNLIHSPGHSAPLMQLTIKNESFFIPAFNGAIVGEKVLVGGKEEKSGNILPLKDISPGAVVYNLERNPGDGGKFIRTAGSSAIVMKKLEYGKVSVLLPSKKEVVLSGDCRATLGKIAGDGKILKPFIKAGNRFYKMKARNKLWPRTSAVKVNAVDHPFGSGRGKRIKPKIAQRNAPAGRKVGHLRPRRTGHKR